MQASARVGHGYTHLLEWHLHQTDVSFHAISSDHVERSRMPVVTSDSQGGSEVDQRDFFREEIKTGTNEMRRESCRRMVALIDRIDAEFPDTTIWLLTSHHRLVLMDSPVYETDWLVIIESILANEYYFSYRLVDPPFPGARVHGVAREIEEAMRLIKLAMRESGGWIMSKELGNGV